MKNPPSTERPNIEAGTLARNTVVSAFAHCERTNLMRINRLLVVSGLAVALQQTTPSAATNNPVVWDNSTALGFFGAIRSQFSPGSPTNPMVLGGTFDHQSADDFVIRGAAVNITDVHWRGTISNGQIANPGPAFIIRFYADNGTGMAPTGGPGNPSTTALATYLTGPGGGHQVTSGDTWVYSYEFDTPFLASPDVKYWISIQAVSQHPPFWYWSVASINHLSPALWGSTGSIAIPFWSDPPAPKPRSLIFTLHGIVLGDCPGDVNEDGFVGIDDLLEIIAQWGPCPVPPAACPANIASTGGIHVVNVDDLLAVITGWGPCP